MLKLNVHWFVYSWIIRHDPLAGSTERNSCSNCEINCSELSYIDELYRVRINGCAICSGDATPSWINLLFVLMDWMSLKTIEQWKLSLCVAAASGGSIHICIEFNRNRMESEMTSCRWPAKHVKHIWKNP